MVTGALVRGLRWTRGLFLSVAFSALAIAGNEPTCADRVAAAEADLSTLTAAKMHGWGVGLRTALLHRLDAELLTLVLDAERTPSPRASRLVDLTLLLLADETVATENTPGLEKLGIRRLNAGPVARTQDLSEEGDVLEPLTASTYYIQVEKEPGFRILLKWMNASALTDRFKAWHLYKIRFQFPSIQGFGGPHLADWIPCFHGPDHHPGILTNFRGAGQRWDHNLMPGGPSHRTLEKSSPAVFLEPQSDLAIRKMECLGWKEAVSILSKLDPDFALTLLKMAGYEAAPFRRDDLFWVRNPSRSTRIAARVLGALKVMHSYSASLLPAGTMPLQTIACMRAELRELPQKGLRERNEYMKYILTFSGPVSAQRRLEYYADAQPAYYYQIETMNRKSQFIEKDAIRILKEHSLDKEDRSYWSLSPWAEYDLLRTLDFVVKLGLTFDENTNEWVRI